MIHKNGRLHGRYSHAFNFIKNRFLFGSQVRSTIKEYPVLIMPTHRSYFDFLLVSFVFFAYELPLPVIAAAMGMYRCIETGLQ